jgi:hypothetical protein
MGGVVKTGNAVHDAAMTTAEGVRQVAVAGTPTQVAVTAAEIQYYRTRLASAIANKCDNLSFILQSLRALGVSS